MTWPSWLSGRLLAAVGVGVALLAAAAVGGWLWSEAREGRAAAAYADPLARLSAARGSSLTPETRAGIARDLEAALAQHPSARPAAEAALELGNLRFAERDWARARSAWEVAVSRGTGTLRVLAQAGIGYAWEAERNLPKALEAYQAALGTLQPTDFHYAELLLAVARIHELAGDKPAAVETYRRLLKDVPGSPRAEDVRVRLASLGVAP
jgi:tetratricopeptide (TPR) repeat protein